MPRLFHRPPQYRLHKSTKQAVVSLLGKQIYLGPYGSTRSLARYQEILQEWEKSRHDLKGEPRRKAHDSLVERVAPETTEALLRKKRLGRVLIRIDELIFVYRRHTHQYYRKNGEVTREAGVIDDALRVLRKHHGLTSVDDFGPCALDELREAMIDDLDWSRKYINKQINRIRGMFQWACSKEIAAASVPAALRELAGLKKGRCRARESSGVRQVSDAIIDATLNALPPVIADMVRIQRLTSARPGEICSLSPADLDRSADVWIYRPAEHKTEHFEKDRVIAIGSRAQKVLQPYLEARLESAYCFSPQESETRRRSDAATRRVTPVSCGNRVGSNRVSSPKRIPTGKYTTASYRRAIHRACSKLGIGKWSPNQIRHAASTEIRKRFGIDAARAVDGHRAATTTETYAERDVSKAIEVMREIG